MLRAALRRESHVDGYVLYIVRRRIGGRGREIYLINQAQIHNVDRNFRIIATLQRAHYILFVDWHRIPCI